MSAKENISLPRTLTAPFVSTFDSIVQEVCRTWGVFEEQDISNLRVDIYRFRELFIRKKLPVEENLPPNRNLLAKKRSDFQCCNNMLSTLKLFLLNISSKTCDIMSNPATTSGKKFYNDSGWWRCSLNESKIAVEGSQLRCFMFWIWCTF